MATFYAITISTVKPITYNPRRLTFRILNHINKSGSNVDGTLNLVHNISVFHSQAGNVVFKLK